MPLSEEQVKELKNQLKSQVTNLPEDKKKEALEQIDSMSNEAIEEMLKQQQDAPPVYRKIISKEIPAIVIQETEENLAVLDNKPISEGHIVIIPKKEAKTPQEIPKSAFQLAEALTSKIVENFKAKSVKAETETKFGESILNLIPIYDSELSTSSPRSEATPEDLQKVKSKLETVKIEKKTEKITEVPKEKEIVKQKRRIP